MEKRPYYENRLMWTVQVCEKSKDGFIARKELFDYYYNLLVYDLKIHEWFGKKLTINHIDILFSRLEKFLTETSIKGLNSIPFLPVIHPNIWNKETTLRLLSLLEFNNEPCINLIFEHIKKEDYQSWELPTKINEPIYFLGNIRPTVGKAMSPAYFRRVEQKTVSSTHLLSLQDVALLLYSHPTLLSEYSFVCGGTVRNSNNMFSFYPLFDFAKYKNQSEFICNEILSNNVSDETCIPTAYDLLDVDFKTLL